MAPFRVHRQVLRRVASLWIGRALGDIEIASILSFQRLGHEFTLFTYDTVANCPEGVVIRNARDILDTSGFLRHSKSGSPAPHADLFRYAMIGKTDLLWVDLDIVALRPFQFGTEHVFGLESGDEVNIAVLGLPKDSPALARLVLLNETTTGVPPHLTGLRRIKYRVRDLLQGGLPIARWPWGATGPRMLTHLLNETGEISYRLPVTAFYSVPLAEAALFADPDAYDVSKAPEDAFGVHLWASRLKRYVDQAHGGVFPEGSFVKKMLAGHV